MADGDLLAQFDAQHGVKSNTSANAGPDLLAAFDKSLTAKPFGAGHPPPGAIAVQPRQPSVIERLGDFLGKTYGGGDKTANLSLGDLITGAHPNAQSQESGSPLVSGIERGLGAGALDLAGGVENLIGGVPAIVGGVVGHPEIGDRFFQTGDYLRDLANQVAAAGPQSGLAGGAQNVARGLAHYALGPELAAGAAATNSGVEGAQSGAPLNQQFKAAGLEGALAEAGGRIPITGKTLPVKLASGAGLGLAFPFAEHAGQHYVVGNDDVSPLPSLGEVATSEAMMLGLPLIHSAATKLGDVARSAPKPATQPAADTTVVEQALRAAGFSEDQIQAALKNGDLAEVARAATSTPAPALQGPPPDAPLPANATRALPAPEPRQPAPPALPPPPRQLPPPTIAVDRSGNASTNAQALAAARAADAAAQERIALGLTPDVQRAQQARQEGVKAAEAEAMQRGAPGEVRAPEPEAGRAPVDPAIEQRYFDDIDKEIGWDQVDGQIVRARSADDAANGGIGLGPDAGRASGEVTGRTSWIGMPRVDGEGESGFWRNRPANARLNPDQARAALAKARAGEPLKPVEQRFVDYARQTAHEYAQEHADEMARHEQALQEQNDIQRQQDIEQLRSEAAQFSAADANDALALHGWTKRALDAGVPAGDLAPMIGSGTMGERVQRLARAIRERGEHGTDTGTNGLDHAGDDSHAPEGQDNELQPPRGGAAEASDEPRGDLFPSATSRERLRAAREAKDAERNGLGKSRPTPAFTGTDLGATPHGEAPAQTRIPEGVEPHRFAMQKEAGTFAATLRGDARVRRVAGADGKPAWEVTQHASQDVLAHSEPVHEVAESDLSPADRELVQRTRARAAQAQDNRTVESALEQDSRARGEREAGELGLRGAVVEALGPDRMQNVHFVHDEDGLPESVRKRGMPIKRGNVRYGLHTPDGHSYIFTKHANTPERAAWTAIHEVGGHEGVAALVREHPDVKLGNRTLREAYESARKLFLQNPTVAKLADVIGKQRASTDAPRMAEEAMAELQAAARTGRWDEIARKYGVDVPKGVRQGVQGAMANFVRRLKAIVNAVYAKLTGKSREAFTDADVHDMLDSMWQASKDRDAPNLDLVPFEAAPPDLSEAPAQIKSATGNRGTFDAGDPNILHSEEPQGPEHDATMGRGFSGPAIDMAEPKVEPKLPPRAPGESQAAWHARIIREQREPMRNGILRAAGIEPKSAEAKAMRDIGRGGLRAMWAKSQRAADKAAAAFSQAMAVFDRAGRDANLAAIDQWENGQEVTSAPHRLFFKAMDQAFNDRVDAIRKVAPGALEHVIENYFPHLWKDPTKAAKWYQQMAAKRPLDGNKSFLKQRVHDTIKDGMAAGLEPVSTNPVDLVLAKMAQMDKFIALHQFRKDLQARGWLKEMEPGQRVPYGYARVDDPAFVKAAGLQGYFAVPELIARDINNHLSPGLNRFKGFRALRKVENLIMMARLGWSAFHAGFTTLDNLVMHADVGLRYMLQGDMKRSLTTLAKTPFSVVYSPLEGGKLNRQWLGLDDADVHTAALLDALEQGGAHWKMSRSDYNNDLPRFIRSLRQRDYGTSVKTSLSAAGEVGSWLIHHKLVPNQKMAARLLLAKFALDKFAKPLGKERGDYAGIIAAMHPDALKQIMGDVVNNVDDRLGQMNYDNQFWNKTARELAQTAIGAVGWQVGTVRTVTGGVRDVERLWNPEKLLSPLDKGGKITDADMGRISGRLTYLVSLALIMGGGNAALQYMMTGQGPSEVKDYFFPKTGRKNADGSDERLQFPSYWMDHYKLATHPLQTAEHKLHPILSMFMEAISNQDYYGVEIRDPHASWMKQAEQVGEYLAKGFLPYSVTNNRKVAQNEGGIGRQAASFVGVTPAPASVSRSEFQTFVSHNGNKGFGHEKRTAADAEHSRMIHDIEQQVRNGGTPDLSGLSRRDMMRVRRESREEVPEIQFKKMDIEDKLDGWDMASPKERREYHLRNIILNSRGTHTDRFRRLPEDERHAILQRILQIRDGAPAQ